MSPPPKPPMRRSLAAVLVVCTAAAAACGARVTEPAPVLGRAPADAASAGASATLAGLPLSVEAFLWRDFQPPRARDGRPLIATIRIRGPRDVVLPADVQADSLWVIAGGQAWAARAVQEQARLRDPAGEYLEVVARNGPMWAPGTRADVAVRVRDGAGRVAYLRAANREIARTE